MAVKNERKAIRLTQSARRRERVDISWRVAEANAHCSSRNNRRSIGIDGAKCADRVCNRYREDMWRIMANHLSKLLLDDQANGVSTVLAGQNTIKGRRSATTLQMSQDNASHILVDSLFEFLRDLSPDASEFDLQVA